ncbi:OLC1v1017111C1 [Oldenlandia corymbosa var. corymbosa]|uniref:non-specific serine/threonine protein kinase n=1 Tax=Oldenlandia corymbosa var. corymbosa TaxID=529605 RepID=A0AAV1E8Q9_OLDCO|nr:OLC1v1017111C1 [Oldenlandia corymbosa var. corymbosa]
MVLLICCCQHIVAENQSQFFTDMNRSFSGQSLSYWKMYKAKISFCIYKGIQCNNRSNIEMIDISHWGLSGELPENICRYLPELKILRLGGNNLQGSFPFGVTNCSVLEELNMSSSSLSGTLPDLSSLQSLKLLDLSGNFLQGKFPMWLANLTNLEVMSFNQNLGFDQWELPENVSRLTKLRNMTLSSCNLHGKLPASVGNMTSLIHLELSGNFLVNQLPPELGQLKILQTLQLCNNQLEGEIPEEFCNMIELRDIDISGNMLTKLPESLLALPRVSSIDLSNNRLNGSISRKIGNAKYLSELFLQNNRISGLLPGEISGAINLVKMNLSNNLLSGPIPPEIGNLTNLTFLLLQHNMFNSSIPKSLSSLRNVIYLDLSSNGLTGSIPESLSEIKPNSMNFSSNMLSGAIPRSLVFDNYLTGFSGNPSLCVPSDQSYLISSSSEFRICAQARSRTMSRYTLPIGVLALIVFPGIILFLKLWFHKDKTVTSNKGTLLSSFFWAVVNISHRGEIIQSMTDGKILGRGGCGTVYKVELSNGIPVAVKKLHKYALTFRASTKCDVYSFGVVLMELVTGRKPVEKELFGEGIHIIDWICNKVVNKEAGLEVLDPRISESFEDGMLKVLLISMHCTHTKKSSRPTMDEVVQLLLRAADPLTSGEPTSNISTQQD